METAAHLEEAREAVRRLPEENANRSIDEGRGYARAVRDVAAVLETTCPDVHFARMWVTEHNRVWQLECAMRKAGVEVPAR